MRGEEFSRLVNELAERRDPFAIATVTRTEGSTLAKMGFRILIARDGDIVGGSLGGGCPEGPIVETAKRTMEDGEPRLLRVHLVDAEKAVEGMTANPAPDEIYVETNCGGTLEVFVDPMMPSERLVIIGQGGRDDVAEAVARLAKELGLEILLVDPVPDSRIPADKVVESGSVDPKALALGPEDSVVVFTRGERDVDVLQALSRARVRFLGMLASRHRLKGDLEKLRAAGVAEEFLASLHAPIGLDIGAKTPAEIAIAILAEIIAVKYGKAAPRVQAES